MNKYDRAFQRYEAVPSKINKFLLDKILFSFKMDFSKGCDYITDDDLNNNNFWLLLMNGLITKISDKDADYIIKRYLNKLRKSSMYQLHIQNTCNRLLEHDEEGLTTELKSLVKSRLVKDAKKIELENQNAIDITLQDNSMARFSHIPLDEKLIDAYRDNCHTCAYYWAKSWLDKGITCKVATVLEPFEVYGSYYHSFVVTDDGTALDLSHNIMIAYNDYLKLIRPKVLVCEDNTTYFDNIEKLKSQDEVFASCVDADPLKYAISKQLRKRFDKN